MGWTSAQCVKYQLNTLIVVKVLQLSLIEYLLQINVLFQNDIYMK